MDLLTFNGKYGWAE